jgi:hypothetical protein
VDEQNALAALQGSFAPLVSRHDRVVHRHRYAGTIGNRKLGEQREKGTGGAERARAVVDINEARRCLLVGCWHEEALSATETTFGLGLPLLAQRGLFSLRRCESHQVRRLLGRFLS